MYIKCAYVYCVYACVVCVGGGWVGVYMYVCL